jgi:hypothetical protein
MKDEENRLINSRCREEWEKLILSWVHNEIDRKMLTRRMLDGVCLEPLSEEFNMSVNRCQERVNAAKKQLFEHVEIL